MTKSYNSLIQAANAPGAGDTMVPVTIRGNHDERTVQQLMTCVTASHKTTQAALCADGHVGYSMPIGGVIAYHEMISPSGVGYDIGCGNKAVLTDIHADDLSANDWRGLADEIERRISFGVGRKNNEPADHPVLDSIRNAEFAPQRQLLDLAASQLGTVGAGNHYVDVFTDDYGRVWVGVHFGSRGFGHKTASGFLSLAQGGRFEERGKEGEMDSPPVLLSLEEELGASYVEAMQLAGQYAYAGRELVVEKVLDILTAFPVKSVHNHHNFAWDRGGGEWVHRKGSTPNEPGQQSFIGSSMGGESFIVEGLQTQANSELLHSTIHGAGRAMSRTQAAGKFRKGWVNNVRDDHLVHGTEEEALAFPGATKAKRAKRVRMGGAINWDHVIADLVERGIELRGGAADEAPGAYKNINEVLSAHWDTIQVIHRLTPRVVVMAGPDTYDPFKD